MIQFLLKGLLRDRSRSLFPVMITASGVAITVFFLAWIGGILDDTIETSAGFQTGHLKVITKALKDQYHPNVMELSLNEAGSWQRILEQKYPEISWTQRIQFGGLLDIPDRNGETVSQASVAGMAVDLFSKGSKEHSRLKLKKSLKKGRLPEKSGEIMISDSLFEKLHLKLGQTSTLISSDMNGSVAVSSYVIVGTITFGITMLDRGAMLADVTDMQMAFNMIDATSEILGYFNDGRFLSEKAMNIAEDFNKAHLNQENIFSPIMITLKDHEDLGQTIDFMDGIFSVVIIVFIFIISIVLWNAGLMNGIRRYGEIGVRLAIGESNMNLYWSLVLEAAMIGIMGYIVGTILGLIPSLYLQAHGLDLSYLTKTANMMMSNVWKAKVTPVSYWVGIIPGVIAPVIGALISGIRIFKRDTSQLFKELEV